MSHRELRQSKLGRNHLFLAHYKLSGTDMHKQALGGLAEIGFLAHVLRGKSAATLKLARSTSTAQVNERYCEWLLKNSHSRSSQKFHRARMPYKRRSRFWWTFSIPPPGPFFQKREFFNSHFPITLTERVLRDQPTTGNT